MIYFLNIESYINRGFDGRYPFTRMCLEAKEKFSDNKVALNDAAESMIILDILSLWQVFGLNLNIFYYDYINIALLYRCHDHFRINTPHSSSF